MLSDWPCENKEEKNSQQEKQQWLGMLKAHDDDHNGWSTSDRESALR